MKTEKQLMSLINAARVLTSTLDSDEVLQRLVHEVKQVIEGADGVVLFIYDSKLNKLVVKNGAGFDMRYLKNVQLAPEEAMTGKTFSSKNAKIFTHHNDTKTGMSNIESENQIYYQKSLGGMKFPISTICAPLHSKGECIGVLTIDSFSKGIHFSKRDLELLETFAAQATIAIENARLFSQNERSIKIHTQLSEASLSQKGLSDLTIKLANLVDKGICVFNEFFDLLAFSSDEVKNRATLVKSHHFQMLKKAIHREGVYQDDVVTGQEKYRLYFLPIKFDGLTIGLLTVFADSEGEGLDPLNLLAIQQANNILAMETMGQERALSEHFKYQGYLLERIFEENVDGPSFRSQIGASKTDQFICVRLELKNALNPFQTFNHKRQQFSRLVYRELNFFHYKALVLDRNKEFQFLFIMDSYVDEDEVLKELSVLFQRLHEKAQKMAQVDFYAGLGRVFRDLKEIQRSRRDAVRCVEYLKTQQKTGTLFSYKQLGMYRLFLKQDTDELHEYVHDHIGPLLTYDEKQGTTLVQTLKHYFECNQNLTETAARSYVHLNTVKYRMKKIKELLQVDPMQGREVVEKQLAVYIYEFLNESS
ncbi:MAG TPA: helix-turn-helix domain-containing protein [Bacillales bacterium]|nr:helix-turn-helix domain-containing protein [Bacillales bacterium]